jgi:hypothetical protein
MMVQVELGRCSLYPLSARSRQARTRPARPTLVGMDEAQALQRPGRARLQPEWLPLQDLQPPVFTRLRF